MTIQSATSVRPRTSSTETLTAFMSASADSTSNNSGDLGGAFTTPARVAGALIFAVTFFTGEGFLLADFLTEGFFAFSDLPTLEALFFFLGTGFPVLADFFVAGLLARLTILRLLRLADFGGFLDDDLADDLVAIPTSGDKTMRAHYARY